MTDTIREALAAQPEPEYCEHAWKYGGRHAGCVAHCGLPRRPPTAAPTQPDNDQSGGGAVAPEQAKVEKAGVASGPPDPTAALACVHCGNATVADDGTCIACGFPQPTAAPAQGEPRNLTRDEQQMLGRALRASAREVTEYREPPTLADAIAAGDGTLHGAIDYWHSRAIRAEAERDALRADAERYRWLRGGAPAHSERWSRWNLQRWDGRSWHSLERTALDAAIDAARGRA